MDFAGKSSHGSSSSIFKSRLQAAAAGLALAAVTLSAAGCGDVFRPPVSSISPVGPAPQPTRYAIAISDPGSGLHALYNMIDFSGDTVLNTTAIGIAPKYFILGASGTQAFVLNTDNTISTFGVTSSLQTNQIQTSTLPAGSDPNNIFPGAAFTYITEPGRAAGPAIAAAQGSPPSIKTEVSVGTNPVYIVGLSAARRLYVVNQGSDSLTAIETGTNTPSNTIALPAGAAPTYGVMTADTNRAFIMNTGNGTVSVVNVPSNTLDTVHPLITVGGGPVWADLYAPGQLLVTANSTGNSVSVVAIPLCSITAQPSNPACDPNNPSDAIGFGTVLQTIPVGSNPQMVSVLQDGTRAYTANTGNLALAGSGSVSVVNLTTLSTVKTIPFDGTPGNGPNCHPNFIGAIQGTPTGKVYVTCADGTSMAIIVTETDTVKTTIPLQGKALGVRVTQP